jgi:hypothetical protein
MTTLKYVVAFLLEVRWAYRRLWRSGSRRQHLALLLLALRGDEGEGERMMPGFWRWFQGTFVYRWLKRHCFYRWYDLWIGVYIDTEHHVIYFCAFGPGLQFGFAGCVEGEGEDDHAQIADTHGKSNGGYGSLFAWTGSSQ